MTKQDLPPRRRPAAAAMHNLSTLFSLGDFSPASVQRGYEWNVPEAQQLLNDIDKIFSRLHHESDLDETAEDEEAEDVEEGENQPLLDEIDGLWKRLGMDEIAETDAQLAEPETPFAFDDSIVDAEQAKLPPATALAHYFIGLVILSKNADDSHEIYDGLQRFTTLTILFAVLRDLIEDDELKQQLQLLIGPENEYRLHYFGKDKTLAEQVQTPGAALLKKDSKAYYDVGRRILRNKNAFVRQIKGWNQNRRTGFARFLLSSVWVSLLDVADPRLARQMFVSTNLHGKRLDLIDVLKGQLAGAFAKLPQKDAEASFAQKWTELNEIAGASLEGSRRVANAVSGLEETMRAIDAIERNETQHETWPTDFGAYIIDNYREENIERIMGRLTSYSIGWKNCKRVLKYAGKTKIEQDFWRLHVFWWPEWHGLALRWWNQVYFARQNGKLKDNVLRGFQSKFNRLHRRCMAITLADFSETDRQRIFKRAMEQDKNGKDVFTGALKMNLNQKRKIDRTLSTQIHSRETWAPLIRWIEISKWRGGLPDLIRNTNTEHVRPLRPDWQNVDDDGMNAYNNGCFSLGNITIINRVAHDRIQNENFTHKLPVLRGQAEKFITMHSVVYDDNEKERTGWTDADIEERAEYLRKFVWKLLLIHPPKT